MVTHSCHTADEVPRKTNKSVSALVNNDFLLLIKAKLLLYQISLMKAQMFISFLAIRNPQRLNDLDLTLCIQRS